MQRIFIFFAFSVALFFFIACSVKMPEHKEITKNLPQNFKNTTLISIATDKNTRTFNNPTQQIKILFNDSTLNTLFEIALEKNLDLQITNTKILQAKSQLKSAWSELFPQINANINVNQSYTKNDTRTNDSNSVQMGATLSWELDIFGRLRYAKNARLTTYEKSLQDYENAKIILLSEIANLYFTLLETYANLELTQLNLEHYTSALELTRLKVENGLLDSTELFEKQDLLTNEQNTKEQLKATLEENTNALLILLDLKTLPFAIHTQTMPKIHTQLDLNALPADIILARPDIKASLLSLYGQIYNKANAKASLFPILSISANISDILDSSTQNAGNLAWQFAGALSAPLLNRTKLTQNYFLQDALVQESYLTLQQALNTAFGEIENASFSLNTANLQLQNNQKRLDNALNYYDFSYNRHQIGLIDSLDHALNTASLNNAKKSLNSTISQNLKALSLLYKTFGGNLNL